MQALKGAKLKDFQEIMPSALSKVADLIYFDGPLLSLYRNRTGDNLLFHWVDCDSECNRWLVCHTPESALRDFYKRRTPLRELILNPKNGYLHCLDINSKIEIVSAWIVSPEDLTNDYLPKEDSTYAFEPIRSKRSGLVPMKVGIKGDWTPSDFGTFPRRLSEAFAYIANLYGKGATRTVSHLPMKDGYSTKHLFARILSSLPAAYKPQLVGLHYASPGALNFHLDAEIADRLLTALLSVRQGDADLAYNHLHKYLEIKKLLAEDVKMTALDPASAEEISHRVNILAEKLHVPILPTCENSLETAKIVLAFYRLLQRVVHYETQGMVDPLESSNL